MDQKTLRNIEKQCIQEEAPACQSGCPLHLDARTFIRQVREGKWSDAWKTLNKTLPFPGILARICDHPCEATCLRHDLGGAIRISALERACVQHPKPRIRTLPMPSKNVEMAVLGSELSSLVVALDLLRKGYGVTLFSDAKSLGESLRQMGEERLPEKVVESELALLDQLGVKRSEGLPPAETLSELLGTFKALYIGLDDARCVPLVQNGLPGPGTFALTGPGRDGQFAGGNGLPGGGRVDVSRIDGRLHPSMQPLEGTVEMTWDDSSVRPTMQSLYGTVEMNRNDSSVSPIMQVFEGRAAALSMERFAQGVSLGQGRDNEGRYPTRLVTDTRGVEPKPPVMPRDPEKGYTDEEAKAEAGRCLHCECLACVKVCPYLEAYKGYPKKYAREIYNNASIVQGHHAGHHAANLMINSCSLCGLCTEICPGDFSMAALCLDARRDMVERRYMPPSAHEFALLDMQFSNSDRFFLARHAEDRNMSRYLFFPGCQLSGTDPDKTAAVYHFLCSHFSEETGLMLGCCGAPGHWAGNRAETEPVLTRVRENWDRLGKPTLIAACSSCLETIRAYLPEIETISLWEVLDTCDLPDNAFAPQKQMAIHDPCTTRHVPEIQAAARSLAGKLGISLQELALGREKTECCGFGGLMQNANPGMAKKQIEQRANESDLDYLAYCAVCREQLRGSDKRCVHLIDFLFPEKGDVDVATRPKIGISERRENRVKLKQKLSEDLAGKSKHSDIKTLDVSDGIGTLNMKDRERMVLHISPDVARRLEERRILHDDIRETIAHGEATGQKMQSDQTGHFLACHRPRLVTFWVEFSPADTGYYVHNGYCHRMEIKMGKKVTNGHGPSTEVTPHDNVLNDPPGDLQKGTGGGE